MSEWKAPLKAQKTPRPPTESATSLRATVTPRGLRHAPTPRGSVVDSGLDRLRGSSRVQHGSHDFNFVLRLADETTFLGNQWEAIQAQDAEVFAFGFPSGSALEVTQGQILSHSPTDATSSR